MTPSASQSRLWTLAPISAAGLREVIEGPTRLANLHVSEIKEAMSMSESLCFSAIAFAGRHLAPNR